MVNNVDSPYDPEFELLGKDPLDVGPTDTTHAYRTAPIVTGDALHGLGSSVFPQRALYGRILAQQASGFSTQPISPKIYINTNAPFSALVCGVQGSGKSHSTSVLLESCLISDERLGTLPAPLSGLVFHFDTAAGGGMVQPCEAAYLAALDPELGKDVTPPAVTVLVLPNNLRAMRRVYAGLPAVTVEPLHFAAEDISGERLLTMMKGDENTQMPLYMEAIMSILRSMEGNFDYTRFRDQLRVQKFNTGQKAMLNLRLSLLDSCLQGGSLQNRVSSHFRRGRLTIIDLSSPFMDGSSACGFFDLILGLFVEADIGTTGKVIVLDEAHKYLSESQSGTSARLTDSLLTVIRQQRHLATRVVISTQEPTIVPSKYLDLCSFIIAHRFSSPKWLKTLAEHVSFADNGFDDLFSKIVSLATGQAILFSPNGLGMSMRSTSIPSSAGFTGSPPDTFNEEETSPSGAPAVIGQGYLHVRSRLRVTRDGGHSILAVADEVGTTRLGRVLARDIEGVAQDSAGWAHSAIPEGEEVPEAIPSAMAPNIGPLPHPTPMFAPDESKEATESAPAASVPITVLPPHPTPAFVSDDEEDERILETGIPNITAPFLDTTPVLVPDGDEEVPELISTERDPAAVPPRYPTPTFVPASIPSCSFSSPQSQLASPMVSSSFSYSAPPARSQSYNPYLPEFTLYPAPFANTSYSPSIAIAAVVNYLQSKRNLFGITRLSLKHVRKELRKKVPGLSDKQCGEIFQRAEQQGLLSLVSKKRGFWVMLSDVTRVTTQNETHVHAPRGWATDATHSATSNAPTNTWQPASSSTSSPVVAALQRRINTSKNPVPVVSCPYHLLPLMRHILSVHPTYSPDPDAGLSISAIRNYFQAHNPALYGGVNNQLENYKRVVSEAIFAGLLVSTRGEAGTGELSRVTIVPGAEYAL